MKVGELKGLLDGLQDDTLIGIISDEFPCAFTVGEINASINEYFTLVENNSCKHNRYLTIEDLRYAISEMADNALVYVKFLDRTWQPNRFENGNFYVNG